MWEILAGASSDGWPAINLHTSYTIVLSPETIQSCWIVPRSADYDALLADA